MSFLLQSDIPVWHEPVAFFGPDPMQVGESRVIDDSRYGVIHLPPQLGEGGIRLALGAGFSVLAAFKEPEHLAHANLAGRARQQIPAFAAAPRFHKAALFQTGQNQLQELLWDLLTARDLGNLNGLTRWLGAKVEDSLQGVFTFHG